MAFGDELKDQLPAINSFTTGGIAFISDLRDYLKEKSSIEKEYATRLDQLNKRFYLKRNAQGQQLVGDLHEKASKEQVDPAEAIEKYGTLFKAWENLLRESDEISKAKASLSEKIITEVTDLLKHLATKQEEGRKKHMTFSLKLLDERNKAYADKEKCKQKYFDACDQVEASKQKHEKATDDKQKDKLKRQWNLDIQEMNTAKNNYVLAVHVANAFKRKYYNVDMPQVMNQLQEQNEIRIKHIREFLQKYMDLEKKSLEECQSHQDQILGTINVVEEKFDTNLFCKLHKAAEWKEPEDFKFETSLLWKDTDELITDDSSKIYLYNKLGKIKGKLSLVENEINNKKKELEGLTNLFDAYVKNPSTGDSDDVREQIIEALRSITISEGTLSRYTTSIQVIIQAIGEEEPGKRHNLVKHTFAIPTTCDFCQEKIWGLTQQGLSCKDCAYNCHAKCEMRVPPYCTNEKPKKGEKRLAISPSQSTITTGKPASTASSPGGSSLSTPMAAGSSKSGTLRHDKTASTASTSAGKMAKVLFGYEAINSDELTIEEGHIIKILVNDDGSGWLKADLNGQEGLVPSSYVEIITGSLTPTPSSTPAVTSASKTETEKARALFDYDAQNPDELSIMTGDVMEVIKKGDDGWWEVNLKGKVGLIPSTYVEIN